MKTFVLMNLIMGINKLYSKDIPDERKKDFLYLLEQWLNREKKRFKEHKPILKIVPKGSK